jgi:hypothetical protein
MFTVSKNVKRESWDIGKPQLKNPKNPRLKLIRVPPTNH